MTVPLTPIDDSLALMNQPSSDLDDALKEMEQAQPGYDKAEQYSDGPVEEVFLTPRLRWIMRRSGVNFQELLGDTIIDAVADRLKIVAIVGGDDGTTQTIEDLDTTALLKLIRPQTNRLTLKFGDYYLFAWKRLDGSMRVVPIDPRNARLFYEPDDPMTPRMGVRRWLTTDKHVRVDLLYADRVESYISNKPNQHAHNASEFQPYTVPGNDDHAVAHEFGRPPLFHFSTDLPGDYGTPEHAKFYPTQDILLKLSLAHMAAVDYTAIPQRYAILEAGVDTTEAEDQSGEVYRYDVVPDTLRRHEHEGKSSLKSQPGSLWFQRGIKSFGQFDPADPAGFLDPAVHHLKIGATATATPLHYFDGVSGSLPSGESLKVAMAPLIAKAEARRDTLDHAWVTFYTSVLAVMGHPGANMDIRWAPIEPTSEAETWTVAKAKQDAGVPVDVTLSEGGYDEATVDAWQKENASGLPERLSQLVQVGEFLASSATAGAAGMISAEQVQAILTTIVGPLDTVDGVDSDDTPAAI